MHHVCSLLDNVIRQNKMSLFFKFRKKLGLYTYQTVACYIVTCPHYVAYLFVNFGNKYIFVLKNVLLINLLTVQPHEPMLKFEIDKVQ